MKERFDVLLDMQQVNKQAMFATITIFLVCLTLYYSIWGFKFHISLKALLLFYAYSLLGIIVHELIHAISFIVIGKVKVADVKLGVMWKTLTPYAHCKVPMTIRAYKIALLLPVILTGFIPLIWGLAIGSLLMVVVAAGLVVGGIGDWLVYRKLMPYPNDGFVSDHPTEIGCIVEIHN